MKTIKKTATVIVMMIAAVSFSFAGGGNDTVTIKTSMQCEDCMGRVEKALAFEKGVKKTIVNLKKNEVTVVYNPKKTNPDKLRAAISKAGYDADEVKADEKAYAKLPKCCQKGGALRQ